MPARRMYIIFLDGLAYDLEVLGAGTGLYKKTRQILPAEFSINVLQDCEENRYIDKLLQLPRLYNVALLLM